MIYLITFFNKKLFLTKYNYYIYNKKFFIIRILKNQKFKFENIKIFIKIFINYKRLKYFIKIKKLNKN